MINFGSLHLIFVSRIYRIALNMLSIICTSSVYPAKLIEIRFQTQFFMQAILQIRRLVISKLGKG